MNWKQHLIDAAERTLCKWSPVHAELIRIGRIAQDDPRSLCQELIVAYDMSQVARISWLKNRNVRVVSQHSGIEAFVGAKYTRVTVMPGVMLDREVVGAGGMTLAAVLNGRLAMAGDKAEWVDLT